MANENTLGRSPFILAAALLLPTVLLGACASRTIQAEWKDPDFAGQSLHNEKVFVVCDAEEASVKRICQDELVAQVSAAGAAAVRPSASEDLAAGSGKVDEKTLAAARNAGAKAVLTSSVGPATTSVSGVRPSVGIGVGGWGGGSIGGGVGVSVPVGGTAQPRTGYGANMVLTDVASGRIMWTSKINAPASRNVNEQMARLAKDGVAAAQKAGFL